MPAFANLRYLIVLLLCATVLSVCSAFVNRANGQGASIDPLLDRLKQNQAASKVSAARQLAEMGTTASKCVPELIECLSDPSADVRVVAAYALAKVSTDRAASIEALQPLLSEASEHVRYSAQWSTAHLASQVPLDLSEPELTQTTRLLEKSLELLQRFDHQPRHPAAIESVLEILRSRIASNAAIEQARSMSSQSEQGSSTDLPLQTADLVEGLYEPNDSISRMQIIRRLRDHQKFPADIRKNVLKFEAAQIDSAILDYAIAVWDESIQADLNSLLNELKVDEILPDYAYQLVERLEPNDSEVLSKLKGWSEDIRQPLTVRLAAVTAISRSKHDISGCVHWLTGILGDIDLRIQATESLSKLGKVASAAELQLISALSTSTDESFKLIGVQALTRIAGDSAEAAKYVMQWLASTPQDSSLLPDLMEACAQFGEIAAPAIPLLRQNLSNSNSDVRLAAAKALQRFGPKSEVALPELLEILVSPSEETHIKVSAARALGATGPTGTNLLLRAILAHAEPTIQVDLVWALAETGASSLEVQSVCLNILNNVTNPTELRLAAANTLGTMGTAARPMVAQLLFHWNSSEDSRVRAMSLLAAARIDPATARTSIEQGLNSESTLIRTNAAFAMHLCGESRIACDQLLSMLNESQADYVIKQAIRQIGSPVSAMLQERAQSIELNRVTRLACCELACELGDPDWRRLLMLVEEIDLGQEFADKLSFHWHTQIAGSVDQHLREIDTLLELTQSSVISPVGRARLANLLSAEGLGAAGDEEYWGGLVLCQPGSIDVLQRVDESYSMAAAAPLEAPAATFPESAPVARGRQSDDMDLAASMEAAQQLEAAHSPASQTEPEASESSPRRVEVFYGTNRQRQAMSGALKKIIAAILFVTIGSTFALTYCAVSFYGRGRRILSLASVLILAVFGSFGVFAAKQLALNPFDAQVAYNHRLADSVQYGKCTVSIPPNHQPGVVEAPMLWKAQLIADPRKHVVLEEVKQLSHQDFFDSVKETQLKKGKNLLVFIHGYNVSFDDAAKRTAQMAFDLDFPGAPIFYSWPSQADWYGYKTDKRQIELSVDHIKRFLEDLAHQSGADTINLVAHSMGNVGLTAALREINSPPDRPLFNQVVLAAPDVDAEVFKRDIAPNIVSKAHRTTLYTSKTDLALIASRLFNHGSRLGDSGPEIVTFPGIETIDATKVDSSLLGHSYYGSNVSVLTDVGHLLRNEPISGRSYLRRIELGGTGYWTFDPLLISRSKSFGEGVLEK